MVPLKDVLLVVDWGTVTVVVEGLSMTVIITESILVFIVEWWVEYENIVTYDIKEVTFIEDYIFVDIDSAIFVKILVAFVKGRVSEKHILFQTEIQLMHVIRFD